MTTQITPRNLILQIASDMRKPPELFEKYITALEENMIESVDEMKYLSG